MTLDGLRIAVTVAALAFAVVTFLLYLAMSLNWIRPAGHETVETQGADVARSAISTDAAVSPADMAKVIKALASLGEGLGKAGPALWSLLGSVLFLLIAAVSAGVLESPPEKPDDAPPVAESAAGAANAETATPEGKPEENLKVH